MLFHADDDDENDFFELPEKEMEAAEFVGDLGRTFQAAFLRRKDQSKVSQQDIAVLLGVGRSRVNRLLSGHCNMTAESMAELAWALGAKAKFTLVFNEEIDGDFQRNYFKAPAAPATGASSKKGNVVNISAKQPQRALAFGSIGSPESRPLVVPNQMSGSK